MTTVLLVDDHAGFRMSRRRLLAAAGYDVVGEAESGDSALAMVRDLRPDVVVLDVHLPDIDGFEVARTIYEDSDPAIIPISSREASDVDGSDAVRRRAS